MRYAIEIANRKPSACSNCQMRNAQKIRWFPRGFWLFLGDTLPRIYYRLRQCNGQCIVYVVSCRFLVVSYRFMMVSYGFMMVSYRFMN